MDYQV